MHFPFDTIPVTDARNLVVNVILILLFSYFFLQHKIDLRDEDPEQMAKRMFTFLRILKFKPKTEAGSL